MIFVGGWSGAGQKSMNEQYMMILERMINFYRRYRIDIWLAILVLMVALLPRVLDLGLFLTADEKNWMERSHAFLAAFLDGRFNDMLQTTHPGVTLLWVVGLVIRLQQT